MLTLEGLQHVIDEGHREYLLRWPGIPYQKGNTSSDGSGKLQTCCGLIWRLIYRRTAVVHQPIAWMQTASDLICNMAWNLISIQPEDK